MAWYRPDQSPQLFGELLVRNHLVTEDQLARAIAQQHNTGQRLGEIFAEWHLLTQQNVQEMLRKQRHLRMAAAFVAAVFAPLEAYAADAVAPATFAGAQTVPLDEARLAGVTGQGSVREDMMLQVNQQLRESGVEVVGDLATLLDPVLGIVEADFTPDRPLSPTGPTGPAATAVNLDGSLSLSVPFSAGALSVRNVRVDGSNTTQQSIDFRTTIIHVDRKN